jgi:hypothetical protein
MKPTTLLLGALAGLAASQLAPAQNLTSNQVMRIHFTVQGGYATPPDVIRLNFGLIHVHQAFTTRNAAIYHCDEHLGTAMSSSFGSHVGNLNLDPSNSWKSPTSLWNFDSPGTMDFTRVQNGTLIGIIEFWISTGAVNIPLNQVNLNMIRATQSNGGIVVGPPPVITHIEISPRLQGPTPGTVNTNNTWTISGAVPSSVIFLGFGLTCAPIPILGTVYDTNPLLMIGVPTDGGGNATFTAFIPTTVSNVRIMAQGVQIAGSGLQATNLRAHTFP